MKNNKGFTLIEVMAVIGIMAMIITIAVPKINEYIYSKRKNVFIINAKNILREVEYKNLDLKNFNSEQLINLKINKLDGSNFDLVKSKVYIKNDEIYLDLVGKGNFDKMYICGINSGSKEVLFQETECDT